MSDFHTKTIEASFDMLNTSALGLTTKNVQERRNNYGYNIMLTSPKQTLLKLLVQQFKSPIIYVLLVAALVSFLINEPTDAWFILAVLAINATIGLYQEYTASQKADALSKVVPHFCHVKRDGHKLQIDSKEITVSDIVILESGDKVPADIRLIKTHSLYVNESLLTGESLEVPKDEHFITEDKELPLGDRQNMLYAGSYIAKGRAVGMVTAIADQTQVGAIATLLASSKQSKAPLILRMETFSIYIAKLIGLLIVCLIFLGLYQNIEMKEIFFLAVALAISAIPEGLPVAITVALSSASHSMSKKNVIVRKLASIEGLGSCTLIASDKTGTLTQNKLHVAHLITPSKDFFHTDKVTKAILWAAYFCNESAVHPKEDGYDFLGDQVDIALASYALSLDKTLYILKEQSKLLDEIPYESENRYSASTYDINKQKHHFIKGSPQEILSMSTLTTKEQKVILAQVDDYASKGFRTIALARKVSDERSLNLEAFEYLGFAAIIDPLREGVKQAVLQAKNAGIEVAMITGDHPHTAYYIAHELGIAVDKDEVMDVKEISLWLHQGGLASDIAHKRVFARVSPKQKQKIVAAFQELGHFVAVTGDGVNDAPALKHANIGISMGKSGTDVAREASDLVLTDDAFTSIIEGIKVGRVAYDNIRKVIHLLISTGFAEVILITLSMIFSLPIALLPVQLLWLNLVTNGIQDVALGLEKEEPGVLNRPPRSPKEPIFNAKMIRRVVIGGLYMGIMAFISFYTFLELGYSEDMARNLVLLLMVLFENVHVFNSRTELHSIFSIKHTQNVFLLLSIISAQVIHLASMYNPFMQNLLHLQPVSIELWLILLLVALCLIIVMEAEKKLFKPKRL